MPSAGAVCPPLIVPIRKHVTGLSTTHIDTSTLVEITSGTDDCKLYFTANGTKPSPFQRKVAGREVTFKYVAPFTLKAGKRTLKAVAVSRDGLRESDPVTKTFIVDDVGLASTTDYQTDDYSSFFETTDLETSDSMLKSRPKTKSRKKTKSPMRTKTPTMKSTKPTLRDSQSMSRVPREAWASSGYYDQQSSGAYNDYSTTTSTPQAPEGPFNPTNYSGTQINVWGNPPANWAGLNGNVGSGASIPPVQYGYLTEQMIQGCNPESKHVTVGDLKKMMQMTQHQETLPPPREPTPPPTRPPPTVTRPPPAIEAPKLKDPPLNPISPGGGAVKENICHIYAHMLDHAKNNSTFRMKISEPKIGRLLEAEFVDEGDGYRISLVMGKPGIPRGSIRKTKPPPKTKEIKKSSSEDSKKKKPPPKSDPYFAMETEDLQTEGTVKAYPGFNAEQDAEVLKKAMKGFGTNEDDIINVLAYRSNPQRVEIRDTYKTMFGKDLIEHLKSELSGGFLETAKCLCMSPPEFDAYNLRKAIKGLGTDDDCLIEILCTRSNTQLTEIKRVYKEKFNKDLEKDVIGDTSGHFKRLLVGLIQANRSDSKEVDRSKAKQDAKSLFEAGEKKWGTDESRFNAILVARSYPQLRATFDEYSKLSKKDMEDVLKSELSGDLLRGMLTIVRCVRNKAGHFARQLQKSMKGMGTDDDTLVRIIVSRCEIDLVQVKEEFQKLTGQTLDQFIADDLTGDYRNIILSIVTGGPPPASAAKSGKGFVEATKMKTEEELDEEVRMESETLKEDPTVTPAENFSAEQDAEALKKAMKGFGTDEDAIIKVLAYRSTSQRVDISRTFKTMFGKDLISELKSELSGGLKKLCVGLCMSSAEFDAMNLNNAIKGLGTDEKVLVEILCSRSNAQLKEIKTTYKTKYGKELEKDIVGDTSGHFKRLMIGLLQANRDESKEFDRSKAKQDAEALLQAGEKKWGTDESRFNVILVARSYAQLRATFQEYAKVANKDIEDSIQSEMSGDLRDGMLAVVRVIRKKPAYFASEFYHAMKGLGTDDDTVCRIMVSRCEVDMVQIKEEFQRSYKQTLGMFITDDTSGDYRKLLLALIREEKPTKGWTLPSGDEDED
ncbi:hypothetical protein ScPMuIL_012868 [Solemya velum]